MQLSIDVSHIWSWQGNLTGIERVEYHIIKHFFENTDTEFVLWNIKKSRFVVISRRKVKEEIINRTSERELSYSRGLKRPIKTITNNLTHYIQLQSVNSGPVVVLAGLWDNVEYVQGLIKLSTVRPLVHVVFDMIPIVRPEYVVEWLPEVYEGYMNSVLPVCAQVLAISECSAKDTETVLCGNRLRVPPIVSFRLGDDVARATSAQKPNFDVPQSYILSVGTIEIRKNYRLLYEVYLRAYMEHIEIPSVVIVGKIGWKVEELLHDIESDPRVKGKIILVNRTTDSQLRWLYENCLFTVFPSLYEGWGLPVTESLKYGKVTLSSSAGSMPEAGGELADYFSPTSVGGLLKLIRKYLNKSVLKAREREIASKYHPLSWEAAAKIFAQKIKV